MTEQEIKDLVRRYERLKSDRSNWETYWQELAEFFLPRRANITKTRASGEKLAVQELYDDTGIQSANVMASGFMGYLTNPSSTWFNFRTHNVSLMDQWEVKVWLEDAEKKTYSAINASNFSSQIHETYLDMAVFGTCSLMVEEDEEKDVRFYSRSVKEIVPSENSKQEINEVFRPYQFTVAQAMEEFGEDNPEEVKKLFKERKYEEKVDFLHTITPRHVRDVKSKEAKDMPFASYHIHLRSKKLVKESGYDEFPYAIARYTKETGEIYGYSPAMNCLSAVKMLNAMKKTTIKAAQKIADPPVSVPHEAYLMPLDFNPAGVNIKTTLGGDDVITPIVTGGQIPVSFEMMQAEQAAIQKCFFVELFFMMSQRKNMTATEVEVRNEEKMLLLGSTLGRLMGELLSPTLKRVFAILLRKGIIPPPPDSVKKDKLKIEYVSPLAKAQKFANIAPINNYFMSIVNMSGINPQVMDNVDIDFTAREMADMYGVIPKVLRDPKIVQAMREEKANQQAQQMELAQGLQAAESASSATKNMAQAQKLMGEQAAM